MDRLDDTVTQMENDKMTLEESYQAFSEGMKLVKMGNDAIDRVEKNKGPDDGRRRRCRRINGRKKYKI
ncbi:MAG: exodeoxyribonuclease VII small subunit [Clostridium sp.]